MSRTELREIVAEVLEIDADELDADTDLTTIETFDSVAALSLMIELDDQAGIKMGPADVEKLRCYGDIEEIAIRQGVELTD